MGPPRKASVLYTPPEDASGRLQPFAERLRKTFVDAGLVVVDGRALKLHATVANTVYARRRGRQDRRRPLVFDATELIAESEQRVFAEDVEVRTVAICRMGASDRDGVKGAGGYEIVAARDL